MQLRLRHYMLRYIFDAYFAGFATHSFSHRMEQLVYVHFRDNALPHTRNCVVKQLAHPLRGARDARQSLQRELRPPLHPGLGLALVRGLLMGDALPVTAHRQWHD